MECDAIPSTNCKESQHNILDRKEDEESITSLQTEVSSTLSQAIEESERIDKHLKTVIAVIGEDLRKLRSLAEKKRLSANSSKIGVVSARQKL